MPLNRRGLLQAGAVAALVSAVGGTRAAAATQATDAERIIAAYRELQVGANRDSAARRGAVAALDQAAVQYEAAMTVTGDQLWADLPTGPGSTYFPTMYYRLRTIAVDWATAGSALSSRPDLPARLATALETLYRTEYNENTAEIGNWYSYEIGVPYWLVQTLVCLTDHLSEVDLRRYLRPVLRFVADPNRRTATPGLVETGANRADKSLIAVVSGALNGDPARVAAGIAAVTDTAGGGAANLVARVTSGDGYHPDGSFIQHDVVPYPGHYGLVLLSALAGLIHVTEGTATQLSAEVRQKVCETVADVYAPFVFAGSMMEPVRGRMLSRQGETAFDAGHQLTAAVVLLARHAPEPTRGALTALAARWIKDDTWAPYLAVTDVKRFSGGLQPVGVPEVEYAEQLLAEGRRAAEVVAAHRVFPQQDRMVHVTPRWSASLGVGSTRICRYESVNGMNLHGWYTGDGVLYTFLPGDQGHYSDAYWPTVDPAALPGTTVKDGQPPALQATPTTSRSWVGGARWDAEHGAHGLDLVSQDGTLTARKSWFFTPEGVLCLGAGITDGSGAAVHTTIENRNLGANGTRRLLVDGRPLTDGQPTEAHWLHLDGVAGYVLLDKAKLTLKREDRTASWFDVDTGANTHGTTVPYTRRYQKVLIEHGVKPTGASYAYAVLPGASPWQTAALCGRWRVLANTAEVQAAQLSRDLVAASFFAAGAVRQVAVSGPAAAVWGRDRSGWTLAIADPTQQQDTIRVTVTGVGRHLVKSDPSVVVVSAGRQLVLDVKVAGSRGATHSVTIS
ncbi:polysaccharide lyase 8 family protein [Kutzneria albida]|uniref:Hyaluronate lyase n=1 Tax=Kutzneria albida DSM 43870 TaxID=1449976 RepID=W5W4V7_9PSEU|nr:polysaccharide lyase 8 family protein [Kutzneria albida]AHH95927.1 hypothetical protein KALB_2559 [Kutzneria albida DSM 43870]